MIKTPTGLVEAKDLKAGDKVITRGGEAVAIKSAEPTEIVPAITFKRRSVIIGAATEIVTAQGDRKADDEKGPVNMQLPNWATVEDEILPAEAASGWAICGSEEDQTLFVNDYCVRC